MNRLGHEVEALVSREMVYWKGPEEFRSDMEAMAYLIRANADIQECIEALEEAVDDLHYYIMDEANWETLRPYVNSMEQVLTDLTSELIRTSAIVRRLRKSNMARRKQEDLNHQADTTPEAYEFTLYPSFLKEYIDKKNVREACIRLGKALKEAKEDEDAE